MNNAWLLTVTSYDGDEVCTIVQGVFSSEEMAVHELAEWCRGQWEEQQHEEVEEDAVNLLDGTESEIVQKYFAFWQPEEGYSLEMLEVDKEL